MRRGAALDSAGKRAAFALFYAPLHYLTVRHVVAALEAGVRRGVIVDLGCGTGTAGAAWAVESDGHARLSGIDRHPAAVDEARWTYHQLGLDGVARTGDAPRTPIPPSATGVMAAYLLNELDDADRGRTWAALRAAASRGAAVLVLEPIARTLTPWWSGVAAEAVADGGRADEWRFEAELPAIVARLDQAAGLRHHQLTARSIYLPGTATTPQR